MNYYLFIIYVEQNNKHTKKIWNLQFMSCGNDTNNRGLPLHYGNSTTYGNVEKRVKHPKNCYLLITRFKRNFRRVSP